MVQLPGSATMHSRASYLTVEFELPSPSGVFDLLRLCAKLVERSSIGARMRSFVSHFGGKC